MNASVKRPQLTPDELQQVKWLLGGALTLLSLWTVFYMDIGGWWLMAATSAVTLAVMFWPTLPARVPGWVHTLAFPAIVAFFVADFWITKEPLPAMVRLDMLLLLYRNLGYRQRRDDMQIMVLGLFLIVVAGVLTVSLAFAVQILAFTACALALLFAITVADAAGAAKVLTAPRAVTPPAWAVHANVPALLRRLRAVMDWRVLGLGALLFGGVVAVTALLFLAIPRFQFENSMFLDRFISKKAKTGFTDTIKFGDVTAIQEDTSVALSVDVPDPTRIPATPYWRMLVLDEYSAGTFRFSPQRRRSLGRERASAGMDGGEGGPGEAAPWTFYLESGVSRYLPLLGRFQQLRFRELQNFQFAQSLNVIALREEPVSMTAYRVQGFDTSGAVSDDRFAELWRTAPPVERAGGRSGSSALNVRLYLRPTDEGTLRGLLEQAAGSEPLEAAAFAERVGAWLRARHGYTLSPRIPDGEADPLLRWMASNEAGHCELFAGSFVLLARMAGFPARVVTGFKGGTWNDYSKNFTVRNSDAHAWTEIFDETSGAWLRADPLQPTGPTSAAEASGAALAARVDRSWSARLDSLRVFWYRRIVNFDQRSQAETLRAVKRTAEDSGRRLREAMERAFGSVREWIAAPWDARRLAGAGGTALLLAGIIWGWREFGRGWWRRLKFSTGGRRDDPVRREAGRWLVRIVVDESANGESRDVRAELQRLRFGARGTWPEPERVFRRARRVMRTRRRRS